MAEIVMLFHGPIKVHVEESPGRHLKGMLRVEVSVTNEKVVFKTGLHAPKMASIDESLFGAGLAVLRTLCIACGDPGVFREIVASGNPQKEGIPVAVTEQETERWIEAGEAMEDQLKEEACPLADDYASGRPVKGELRNIDEVR